MLYSIISSLYLKSSISILHSSSSVILYSPELQMCARFRQLFKIQNVFRNGHIQMLIHPRQAGLQDTDAVQWKSGTERTSTLFSNSVPLPPCNSGKNFFYEWYNIRCWNNKQRIWCFRTVYFPLKQHENTFYGLPGIFKNCDRSRTTKLRLHRKAALKKCIFCFCAFMIQKKKSNKQHLYNQAGKRYNDRK